MLKLGTIFELVVLAVIDRCHCVSLNNFKYFVSSLWHLRTQHTVWGAQV